MDMPTVSLTSWLDCFGLLKQQVDAASAGRPKVEAQIDLERALDRFIDSNAADVAELRAAMTGGAA